MPGEVRYDANDSAPTYIGLAEVNGTPTTATSWVIYKFTYSSTNVTRIQKLVGAWDSRAALLW
jgi:hypothetical protein